MTTVAPTRVAIPLQLGRAAPVQAPLQHVAGRTMGTSWSAKFVGSAAAAQTLRRAIVAALDRVVAQMSPWETNSALSRFNNGPPGEWHELPREFAQVMAEALRIAGESDGAFDPTMGPLVDLWGFGPQGRPHALPCPRDISEQRAICGWRQLEFDIVSRRLRRLSACRLDLNGIAKGFAVDLVMKTLRRHGIHHALVEIGGELAGAGLKPDGTPWWVDIDAPMASSVPALRVALHGLAIPRRAASAATPVLAGIYRIPSIRAAACRSTTPWSPRPCCTNRAWPPMPMLRP